jgi:hypothetical protein
MLKNIDILIKLFTTLTILNLIFITFKMLKNIDILIKLFTTLNLIFITFKMLKNMVYL